VSDGPLLPDLAALRISYEGASLDESSLAATPIAQFTHWFQQAHDAGLPEPNAMVLGTVDPDGLAPSARTVLLKGADSRGFSFFSHHTSRKGKELSANPQASLVFPGWLCTVRLWLSATWRCSAVMRLTSTSQAGRSSPDWVLGRARSRRRSAAGAYWKRPCAR
jgi:hypothetical protein